MRVGPFHYRGLTMPVIRLLPCLALFAIAPANAGGAGAVPMSGIVVVNRFAHDPGAFTQGLLWHQGQLYESTGLVGRSQIRRVTLDGKVVARTAIPANLFGEGLARWGRTLVSITWQGGAGFRWDLATLKRIGAFRYPGEGWGLTSGAGALILSDGTASLRFMDPATFREKRRVTVTLNGRPLKMLNELEYIRGEVWANIWETDYIARIDPASGRVTGMIDLHALSAEIGPRDGNAVLNGIAYDAVHDRIFVTGKTWPKLFEIRLAPTR